MHRLFNNCSKRHTFCGLGKWGIKGACVHLEEMADAVAVGWTAPVPIPFARVCEVGWWAGSACRGEPAASAVACLGANAWL